MTRERRRRIVELVRTHGSARVADLAKLFATSEVTIRSDLAVLERADELVRDHGGAIAAPTVTPIRSLLAVDHRAALHSQRKKPIAQAAAELVRPGDTIILDAGTTVVEMAPHLAAIPDLTIVTNALNVALAVGTATSARIILLGGAFNREASSTVGSMAAESLAGLVVQKAFIGTQAFDLENGLTDTTLEIAEVKRAIIRAAREVILLCDSSKWAHAGFIKVAPLASVHRIFCDQHLPPAAVHAIRAASIPLTLV